MNNQTKIEITPLHSLADQPLEKLLINGLPSNSKAIIRFMTQDEEGTRWISTKEINSDEAGTFSDTDPSSLLYSMHPEIQKTELIPMFRKNNTSPLAIEVTVEVEGEVVTKANLLRLFSQGEEELVREHVDQDGVVGTLFYPKKGGPHSTIICLSGSGGGYNETRASLLASHGFATFALAYFGTSSLPKELSEIPLEFFEKGLSWLEKHSACDINKLGVYGYSKGGELALLLGSTYPQIKAIAAFSPSAYVWQGLGFRRPSSSWTHQGKALTFLPLRTPFLSIVNLILGRPIAFRKIYEKGIEGIKNLENVTINVEKINGPIFLVAGTDDQVWPAADFSDKIVERLKEKEFKHQYDYYKEEGAGHLVGLPYLPSAQIMGSLIFTNSDNELSSKAVIKAWDCMTEFFKNVSK